MEDTGDSIFSRRHSKHPCSWPKAVEGDHRVRGFSKMGALTYRSTVLLFPWASTPDFVFLPLLSAVEHSYYHRSYRIFAVLIFHQHLSFIHLLLHFQMAPVSPNAQQDEALVLQKTRKQRSNAKRKAYREAQGWSDLTK